MHIIHHTKTTYTIKYYTGIIYVNQKTYDNAKQKTTNHHCVIYVKKLMKQSSMLFTNVKVGKKYGKHLNH